MPLFKRRENTKNPLLEKIQATITTSRDSPDTTTGEIIYNILIEGHMAELVSGGVNEIGIFVESRTETKTSKPGKNNIDKFLEKERREARGSFRKKVTSIDPKTFLSHDSLSILPTEGIKKADRLITSAKALGLKSEDYKIADEILHTQVTFKEKPMDRMLGRDTYRYTDFEGTTINYSRGRHSTQLNKDLYGSVMSKENSPSDMGLRFNSVTTKPSIKDQKSKVMSRLTKRIVSIRAAIGQEVRVELINRFGKSMGRVKAIANGLERDSVARFPMRNLKFWNLLKTNKKLFDITVFESDGKKYLSVTTPYAQTFKGFCIYIRPFSNSPSRDEYRFLGEFSNRRAGKLSTKVDWNYRHLINVVPVAKDGTKLSYSEQYLHEGLISEYSSSYNCMQLNNTVRFYIRDLPLNATSIYAVRTDEMTGQVLELRKQLISLQAKSDQDGRSASSHKEELIYDDASIGPTNKTYSYDFFVQDKYGLNKHLFRKTIKTFEKENLGLKIKRASITKHPRGYDIVNATIVYPNAFVPNDPTYSLYSPDDDFFEACRSQKRVAIMSLKRHSDYGHEDDLGIHVLTPGQLNTLEASIKNQKEFSVQINIDSAFLRENNVPGRIDPFRTYYYEIRVGSYLLSNELSFLHEPLKINVPNEFTDGKTGYQYDPLIYESPLRKDYGLLGRMDSSKHNFLLESLTSTTRLLKSSPRRAKSFSGTILNTALGPTKNNLSSYAVLITADLQKDLVEECDHFELYVADSTSGQHTSIGKYYLSENNFYYIDTYSPAQAANKLLYTLIGRNTSFENLVTIRSAPLDISATNIRFEKIDSSQKSSIAAAKESKNRGL